MKIEYSGPHGVSTAFSRRFSRLAFFLLVIAGLGGAAQASDSFPEASVVEIVTFTLNPGVTSAEFKPIDQAVETQHVSKQPGFVARESAAGENGEWVVVVHWRSVKDAEASMAGFMSAPAAADFMSKVNASTMKMKRYTK